MTNLHRHEIRGGEKVDLAVLRQLWLADIAEKARIRYLLP